MQGLHLTADCHDCGCEPQLLTDASRLRALARAQVEAAGLQAVAEQWHSFPAPGAALPSGGVTGVVLLAESHLAIHTWPEMRGATLDVHVCNFGADNSAKAHALMEALLQALVPARVQRHALQRGFAI
jgi:S-adenosylmethionine decarboxylase